MNDNEKKLFEVLKKHRIKMAEALEDPALRGLAGSAEEKYSDQAHFVYELIQNADDAKATEASFYLYDNRLEFIHNGSRLFTISDVEKEGSDKKLGDINALTSYANSTKTEGNEIGRFGLGFKAVLQYTTSPRVYDPNFKFEIIRKVVPVELTNDCITRRNNETAFVIPFNHPVRDKFVAYDEIKHKLESLVNPMLFLRNLKKVSYEFNGIKGEYEKKIIDEKIIDNTDAKLLKLKNGSTNEDDLIWIFTRVTNEGYKYSVGFFLDKDGNLVAKDNYAFCFFPTKKQTNLGFIINAPFLLTDSREGIKAGIAHNTRMIQLLAELAADSFTYLRDIGIKRKHLLINDDFLNILPISREKYVPKDPLSDISFLPFYEECRNAVFSKELLPSYSDYSYASNAYIALNPQITDLFSNEQLKTLTGNEKAKWAFTTIGWEAMYRTHDGRWDYLKDILSTSIIQDTKVIEMIDKDFIEQQEHEWLFKLYDFICSTENRIRACKTKPIFLNKNGIAVSAFDEDGKAILFLDEEGSKGYETIMNSLYSNESTLNIAQKLGIKAPELKDKIYNKILKKENLGSESDFRSILNYYIELVEEGEDADDLVNELMDRKFVFSISSDGDEEGIDKISDIYYPNNDLRYYFLGNEDIRFINIDKYNTFLRRKEQKYLDEFLDALEIKRNVGIKELQYNSDFVYKHIGKKWERSTRPACWIDYRLDNDELVLERIEDDKDEELSLLLWKYLSNIFESGGFGLGGRYIYYYRTSYCQHFDGLTEILLKDKKWLKNKAGDFLKPCEITVQELDDKYDKVSSGSKDLIDFLELVDEHPEYAELDEETRRKLEEYEELKKMGVFDVDRKLLKKLVDEEHTLNSTFKNGEEGINATKTNQQNIFDGILSSEFDKPGAIKETYKKIEDLRLNISHQCRKDSSEHNNDADKIVDEDDYNKLSVDFDKKIKKKEEQFAQEIERINEEERLQDQAKNTEQYSFEWFKCLLNLEMHARGDESENKAVYLKFGKVKLDERSGHNLILEQSFNKITPELEELSDIPLTLEFANKSELLIVEALSIKSYSVIAKLRPSCDISKIKFDEIQSAKLEIRNPVFLLKELRDRFCEFDYDDSFNMRDNLPKNIEFVFGPPGTGKTTYLAKNELIPLMKNKSVKANILVLTPTNKAADVIVDRIRTEVGNDSYSNWLVRFGLTSDENILESGIYKDKHVDIKSYEKSITVTTVFRFSYDYFIPGKKENYNLRDVEWDYIVIDEASMISLAYIIYPLYKAHPKKFIIAGDPFQIEPIVYVDLWKDQNIYKMVNLESFGNPATSPINYPVKTLTTQYRSTPTIGNIYSSLFYDGILKHHRNVNDKKCINFGNDYHFSNINLIRYPVSEYESIYRGKRLNGSSYNIYSSLFTYEFVKYLIEQIDKHNEANVSIGIISPYRAQADIINKLIQKIKIPKKISVQAGTIHSFQGDECDIIVDVFNTPPGKLTGDGIFVNKKNIVNVALSRAKDYLFIIVPDENTTGIENLSVINDAIEIIKKSENSFECEAVEIENKLFGSTSYFEDNSFVTGHQNVNIYSVSDKKYEIRAEDNAVDIQVHALNISNERKEEQNEIKEKNIKSVITKKMKDLLPDVNNIFKDDYFDVKEKTNEGKIGINYLGSPLLDIVDNGNEQFVIITKGKFLDSVSFDKTIEIEYHPYDIVKYRMYISSNRIRNILTAFSEIDEVDKISDEEVYDVLKTLGYNVVKIVD